MSPRQDVVVIGGGIAGVPVELSPEEAVARCPVLRAAAVIEGDETPVEPGDAQPDPLDVAVALERVEAVTGLGLSSVQSNWSGLHSFVADRAPVVGAWPQHPGFHFFAGQGGSGIKAAPALAALGAATVIGGSQLPDIPLDPAALAPTRLAWVGVDSQGYRCTLANDVRRRRDQRR